MSWLTRIWPSQPGPAPMPMVGTLTERVTSSARDAGTFSRTKAKTPACSRARASRRTSSASRLLVARTR